MRILFIIVWCSFTLNPLLAQDVLPLPLNVLTFNIRYDNPSDGRNAWSHRKEMVAQAFTDHQIDIAGVQEALAGQIADLQRLLPGYAWIGVGREDGKSQGEFAPIFYRRTAFALEKQGAFWLSQTPEAVGSKSWDAALPRIATWAIFREARSAGRRLFVLNTHFDHRGEEAQRQSAKLLLERIKALSENLPAVLTGDFNANENSPAIRLLGGDPRFKLTDSRRLSQAPHTGGEATFNDFSPRANHATIDFIFVGPGIQVRSHGCHPIIREGVFVSDHWPVISQILLP
jgi:endonuclease/exonuclease/phosphatase family metal-dependent hydrolase